MEFPADYSRIPDEGRRLFNQHILSNLPYWIAGGLTGLLATGYAIAFRFLTTRSLLLFDHHPILWSALVPVGFLLSFAFVHRFSPAAGGSGIPQVMSAIETLEHAQPDWIDHLLGLRMVLVKIASSIVMIAAGGAIGREGPTIQIGSALFLSIENFFTRRGYVRRKHPATSRRAFILAGGAAGIAAAFNTPLGGIVFAIEELATESFKQFRTTVIIGVIVAGVTAQAFLGSYLYLGQPTLGKMTWLSTALAIGAGALAGLAGGFFGRSLFALVEWRKRTASTAARRYAIVGGLSIVFIGLAFLSRGSTIGSGIEGVGELLFKQHTNSSFSAPLHFLASQVSYLAGGAGGIFSPSLAVGANLGATIASWFSLGVVDSHFLILAGMAAFLTGVTHAPFTSLVLVIEMTDRSGAIIPLMMGTMAAHWFTKLVHEHSFYHRMHEQFLPPVSHSVN